MGFREFRRADMLPALLGVCALADAPTHYVGMMGNAYCNYTAVGNQTDWLNLCLSSFASVLADTEKSLGLRPVLNLVGASNEQQLPVWVMPTTYNISAWNGLAPAWQANVRKIVTQ